jgi:hypothetical protein
MRQEGLDVNRIAKLGDVIGASPVEEEHEGQQRQLVGPVR